MFDKNEVINAFNFLDELRDSGAVNMFGASKYLKEEFDIDYTEARTLTRIWMTTFDHVSSVEDRASEAMKLL